MHQKAELETPYSATVHSDESEMFAPRPKKISDTGLSVEYLCDLISKHMLNAGTATLAELSARLLLPGSIIEELANFLRHEQRLEVLGASLNKEGLRYNLTDRGRSFALEAIMRSGYLGPAPVTLAQYVDVVRAQSIHARPVTQDMIDRTFKDIVINAQTKAQLGLAANSGRAAFIYGPAGSGKTYLTSKLARVFTDTVLIPHAIVVGDVTIGVFDPIMHKALGGFDHKDLTFERGHDQRFQRCERPIVVVGGELTDSMLDVQYDDSNKSYLAPLQLKANNGVFIIDDMGRQKVPPEAIFNRWIVPMEEKNDYLSVGAGRHFVVPFDQVLIFSTNMHPLELADEAFLRRIGYKIRFRTLTEEEYRQIWKAECAEKQIYCMNETLDFVVSELHQAKDVPFLPCHPRDLIGIAIDHTVYAGQPREITKQHLEQAWDNYFVELDNAEEPMQTQRFEG